MMQRTRRRTAIGPAMALAVAAVLAAGVAAAPVAAAAGYEVVIGPASAGYQYLQVNHGEREGFEVPDYDAGEFAAGAGAFGTGPLPCDEELTTAWAPLTDLLVRRTIQIPDDGRQLHLAIGLLGSVQVWLNGTEVTDGLMPGAEDCAGTAAVYIVVPEAALARGDANVLAVRARASQSKPYFDLQAALVPSPANDDAADATLVTAVPFSEQVGLLGATTEAGEPLDMCPTSGWAGDCTTVWYRFAPPSSGPYVVDALLPGDEDPEFGLAVYTGAPFDQLTLLASREYQGWRPILLQAEAGTEYLVQVSGGTRSGWLTGGEAIVTIEAAPDPVADIEVSPTEDLVTATRVRFSAEESSDPAGQPITATEWDFGDGGSSSDRDTFHYFKTPGTYTVTLTVTTRDGRSDTASETLTVTQFVGIPPTASFTWTPEAPENGSDVAFTATLNDPSDIGFETVAWDFGDGGTGSHAWASHQFAAAGDYVVSLEATTWDGRIATASETVTVAKRILPDPQAGFGMWPDPAFTGYEVSFSNQSYDPAGMGFASADWDFGDGATASGDNVSHVFAAEGTYTVRLTVTTSDGRTASTTRDLTVSPPPPPEVYLYSTPSDPTIFDTVQFTGWAWDPAGGSIESYEWDFGDRSGATDSYPTHRYAKDGTYHVSLTATTSDGRHATTEVDITVATRDVAILEVTANKSASAGQTKVISAEVTSRRSKETVLVQFYRGTPQGLVFVTEQRVTVKRDRTVVVSMDYRFTAEDALYGWVTFKVTATIEGLRDALPADNEAVSSPMKITK